MTAWPKFYDDALAELQTDLRRGHVVRYPHVAVVEASGGLWAWRCCCTSNAGESGYGTSREAFDAADRHVTYSRKKAAS